MWPQSTGQHITQQYPQTTDSQEYPQSTRQHVRQKTHSPRDSTYIKLKVRVHRIAYASKKYTLPSASVTELYYIPLKNNVVTIFHRTKELAYKLKSISQRLSHREPSQD